MTPRLKPDTPTGLDYYPLSTIGERFPINDPELKPKLEPRPEDDVLFLQGMLEGIARIEERGYRLLEKLGAPYPVSVRTTGGGAQNPAWTQIRQHYLKTVMKEPRHSEAAYGSALLAQRVAKQSINL